MIGAKTPESGGLVPAKQWKSPSSDQQSTFANPLAISAACTASGGM